MDGTRQARPQRRRRGMVGAPCRPVATDPSAWLTESGKVGARLVVRIEVSLVRFSKAERHRQPELVLGCRGH